ncbi:MAG: hypothetical protein JXX14_00210 [Deltaproteobacteria bacterium]|nr:hypothetical protein [Deltaproteobacteria bacterium]
MENFEKHEAQQSAEKNIVVKTVVSVIAAGAIAALSLVTAYSVVTAFQPATGATLTAAACGDKDGNDPKVFENTCGEDKDDGGGKTIDA